MRIKEPFAQEKYQKEKIIKPNVLLPLKVKLQNLNTLKN